jgi:hypothetical protein
VLKPIIVSVNVMFDQGSQSGQGLTAGERAKLNACQGRAVREYAVSGIHFDVRVTEGAYLRQQGYSVIPEQFLARKTINVFVSSSLGYDIDRDRTGGCSSGPSRADPYYKTFLGIDDAGDGTLAHEYAHHFTLDTRRNSSWGGNFWADARNDYWLWEQRHGTAIPAFRACANSEWARV